MELFEEAVMGHLIYRGETFISPQYSIRAEDGGEWARPDFVALNFPKREVHVVEVATGYSTDDLARKVNDRKNQWFEKLRKQLTNHRVVDETWSFLVKVYVRRDRVADLRDKVSDHQGVIFEVMEETTFPWTWVW